MVCIGASGSACRTILSHGQDGANGGGRCGIRGQTRVAGKPRQLGKTLRFGLDETGHGWNVGAAVRPGQAEDRRVDRGVGGTIADRPEHRPRAPSPLADGSDGCGLHIDGDNPLLMEAGHVVRIDQELIRGHEYPTAGQVAERRRTVLCSGGEVDDKRRDDEVPDVDTLADAACNADDQEVVGGDGVEDALGRASGGAGADPCRGGNHLDSADMSPTKRWIAGSGPLQAQRSHKGKQLRPHWRKDGDAAWGW